MADTNENSSPYSADPHFQQYYDQILASMTPQTIAYQAPTVDEIAQQISGYLRPSTDAQIRSRQRSTVQQRAATDVDAASRGMLPSTWVTDYKNRLSMQENSDIADIEAAYRAQLLQGVAARQQDEANRAYQIAMFNAQMRQAAEESAYDRAGDMYQIYLNGQHSGGGSGGGGSQDAVFQDDFDAFMQQFQQYASGAMGNHLLNNPLNQPVLNLAGRTNFGGLK